MAYINNPFTGQKLRQNSDEMSSTVFRTEIYRLFQSLEVSKVKPL